MVNKKTITLSCKYFWGFSRQIDIDEIDSNEEIINFILNELKLFLKENNLLNLIDILNDLIKNNKYHIHDFSFADILLSNEIIYVCSH